MLHYCNLALNKYIHTAGGTVLMSACSWYARTSLTVLSITRDVCLTFNLMTAVEGQRVISKRSLLSDDTVDYDTDYSATAPASSVTVTTTSSPGTSPVTSVTTEAANVTGLVMRMDHSSHSTGLI